MKKLTTLLTTMAMVFVMSGKAQAVPFYYTFEGIVTDIVDNTGGIAAAGLSLGDSVTHTFIVDFDAPGTETFNNGTVYTRPDIGDNHYFYHFFYADYVSGDILAEVGGGYYNDPTHTAEFNYGMDMDCNETYGTCGGGLRAGSYNNDLSIFSRTTDTTDVVSAWTASSALYFDNRLYDSTGAYSRLVGSLTLTDISPVNAVPEPSTLLLLASGMLGLLAFRRRQLTTQV